MFTNRVFNVFVVLALGIGIFLTVREAANATAPAKADRVYDQVELVRTERLDWNLQADHSYDAIETQRLAGSFLSTDRVYDQVETLRSQRWANTIVADRSYDLIENLRAMRTTTHS